MKRRYIKNAASSRARNPEFKKCFGFLTLLLSSRNTLWPRLESDFFSALAALKLEGEPINFPWRDEPGRMSRAEGSPCSAQALKLVWAHPPLSQPAEEFGPGKRGPALSLHHHQKDPCEQRRREEQQTRKGQQEELWRRGVPWAESWGPAWASSGWQEWLWGVPAAGFTLPWLLEHLGTGMDSKKVNLPHHAALHLFVKLQFCISPLFLTLGILSDVKHFV